MACYYPIDCWRSKTPNDNGKYPMVFNHDDAVLDDPLKIPCGRCLGCKLEYSRNWAVRCVHESSLHEENCFITLTYDPEHLPEGANLKKKHWQDFMKRLRKHIEPQKIRFFMCGEYGENQDVNTTDLLGRPHFHALIFGYDFPDKIHEQTNDNGDKIYGSDLLTNIWGFGHTSIGQVTFESAAYVARYCTKKITGEEAEDHYQRADPTTGEITFLQPEFTLMSRKPGIAYNWFKIYKNDLKKDFITLNGVKMRPPKYYDKLFEKYDDGLIADLKRNRSCEIDPLDPELGTERLRVKEKIKKMKLKMLPRALS